LGVFWGFFGVLGRVLGGFWEGHGRPGRDRGGSGKSLGSLGILGDPWGPG
jgi:hypothetical protein